MFFEAMPTMGRDLLQLALGGTAGNCTTWRQTRLMAVQIRLVTKIRRPGRWAVTRQFEAKLRYLTGSRKVRIPRITSSVNFGS